MKDSPKKLVFSLGVKFVDAELEHGESFNPL